MMKLFLFFVLACSFLFTGGCSCNNSDAPNGPAGQEEENKGDGKAGDEKKETLPTFSLELAEGVSRESLYVNEPIPLVLKGSGLSNAAIYKIILLETKEGKLFSKGPAGKELKEIQVGEEIHLENGTLPLVFISKGKVGMNYVKLVLSFEDKKSEEIKLSFDLKNILSVSSADAIRSGKVETITLKINASPDEEFTIKSITSLIGNAELSYESKEKDGVWGEVRPVRVGDKIKGGEHQLDFKQYGFYDQVQGGIEILRGIAEKKNFSEDSGIEIVVVDSKGNEYKGETKFRIKDISFEIKIGDIQWFALPYHEEFKERMFQIEYEIKDVYYGEKEKEYGNDLYKIISFKSNDNTHVSLIDYFGNSVVGKSTIGQYSTQKDIYFRLDEINLNIHGDPLILTMKIQGPEGNIKSADIEIGPQYKEYVLHRSIDMVTEKALAMIKKVNEVWYAEEKLSNLQNHAKAEEVGEEAAAFIRSVHQMGRQIESIDKLREYVSSETREKIVLALSNVNRVKEGIEFNNKKYGINISYQ